MDIGDGINGEQQATLKETIKKHSEAFSKDADDIGYCDLMEHRITTADNLPTRVPHRRIPPHLWNEGREYLQKALENDIIQESSSLYAAAVALVGKMDNSLRLCCDYRQLNANWERFNRTLHDLLRTLPQERKRKWPGLLPELLFAYNYTPHRTTGYAPYYLPFGREPRLPLDAMLAKYTDEPIEWVTDHHNRLSEAFQLASERTELESLKRQKRVNTFANDKGLLAGTRLFLTNHFKGRHKIQDVWNPVPHRITKVHENNVYTVQSLEDASVEKRVHRSEIIDSKVLVDDVHPPNVDDSFIVDNEATTVGDFEDDDRIYWSQPAERDNVHMGISDQNQQITDDLIPENDRSVEQREIEISSEDTQHKV